MPEALSKENVEVINPLAEIVCSIKSLGVKDGVEILQMIATQAISQQFEFDCGVLCPLCQDPAGGKISAAVRTGHGDWTHGNDGQVCFAAILREAHYQFMVESPHQ